jgi:hypothetical protein
MVTSEQLAQFRAVMLLAEAERHPSDLGLQVRASVRASVAGLPRPAAAPPDGGHRAATPRHQRATLDMPPRPPGSGEEIPARWAPERSNSRSRLAEHPAELAGLAQRRWGR